MNLRSNKSLKTLFRTGPGKLILLAGVSLAVSCLTGCAVAAVSDAAVTVAATAVSAGATVVGAAVDVAGAGVRAVTPSK